MRHNLCLLAGWLGTLATGCFAGSSEGSTTACQQNAQCEAGFVCLSNLCEELCAVQGDCGSGQFCSVQQICVGRIDSADIPQIEQVLGNDPVDTSRIRNGLVIQGSNLEDAAFELRIPSGALALEPVSQSAVQALVLFPANVTSGRYTLFATNQSGSANTEVTLTLPELDGAEIKSRLEGNADRLAPSILPENTAYMPLTASVLPGNLIYAPPNDTVTVTPGGGEGVFASLQEALDFLQPYRFRGDQVVTIQIEAGIYTSSEEIFIEHPDSHRLRIVGVPGQTELRFPNSSGIRLLAQKLLYLDGVILTGPGTSFSGVLLQFGSFVEFGPDVAVRNWNNGVESHGATIYARQGQIGGLLAENCAHGFVVTDSSYADLQGTNARNNSSSGYFLGNGSTALLNGANAVDNTVGLLIHRISVAEVYGNLPPVNYSNNGENVVKLHPSGFAPSDL